MCPSIADSTMINIALVRNPIKISGKVKNLNNSKEIIKTIVELTICGSNALKKSFGDSLNAQICNMLYEFKKLIKSVIFHDHATASIVFMHIAEMIKPLTVIIVFNIPP